jgi:hypothetical protein
MSETMDGGSTWHILNAISDLVNQANLNEKHIESEFGPAFRYKGMIVILISHKYQEHLVVGMEGKEDSGLKAVMDGFSKVVDYKPFCKYTLPLNETPDKISSLVIYEWDRINPSRRYAELSSRHTVSGLAKFIVSET